MTHQFSQIPDVQKDVYTIDIGLLKVPEPLAWRVQ